MTQPDPRPPRAGETTETLKCAWCVRGYARVDGRHPLPPIKRSMPCCDPTGPGPATPAPVAPDETTGYDVRRCRDHWHVTSCGEDLAPCYATEREATEACEAYTREAQQEAAAEARDAACPRNTPAPVAPREGEAEPTREAVERLADDLECSTAPIKNEAARMLRELRRQRDAERTARRAAEQRAADLDLACRYQSDVAAQAIARAERLEAEMQGYREMTAKAREVRDHADEAASEARAQLAAAVARAETAERERDEARHAAAMEADVFRSFKRAILHAAGHDPENPAKVRAIEAVAALRTRLAAVGGERDAAREALHQTGGPCLDCGHTEVEHTEDGTECAVDDCPCKGYHRPARTPTPGGEDAG